MAGVKGKHGGPRANSGGPRANSGGARPGAGRKPSNPPAPTEPTDARDPLQFLLDVMQGKLEPSPDQLKAGIAAAQYVHIKAGDGGKKDAQKEAAKKVANKFAAATPPKLVAAGGKKV